MSSFRREAVFIVCQANLARLGREQPKSGRSALKGGAGKSVGLEGAGRSLGVEPQWPTATLFHAETPQN